MNLTIKDLEAYLFHNYGHWANEQGVVYEID